MNEKIEDNKLMPNFTDAIGMDSSKEGENKPFETSIIYFRPKAPAYVGDCIPFYWNGEYHVFYMRAGETESTPWAHISSKDLVHWKVLPEAIKPGIQTDDPDHQGCWTGSIVEHKGLFHMFYTGKNLNDPKGDQKVMRAISTDLIRWEKQPDDTFYADGGIYWSKPINGPVDDKIGYHHQAFRDPEVFWNEDEGNWWMLLHALTAFTSTNVFALYVSDDLVHWEPRQPLATNGNDCPNIFSIKNKWYIILAGRNYLMADNLSGPYSNNMLSHGAEHLEVPKTIYDGSRRVLIGWLWDKEGYIDNGARKWGGTMSMARELFAGSDGKLYQRPVQEIINYFDTQIFNLETEISNCQTIKAPSSYMLNCNVEIGVDSSVALTFRQQLTDCDCGYKLILDTERNCIVLKHGEEQECKINVTLDINKPIDIRVFLLNDMIECFVNNSHNLSAHIYNYKNGSLSLDGTGSYLVKNLSLNVNTDNK